MAEARHDQAITFTGGIERRVYPRHAVDCAAEILPVSGSAHIRGRLTNLSLGGCLVVAEQRYTAGIMLRVEVQFQLRGIAFRIVGVTVGSRKAKIFAVRFLDMSDRRRRELAEVLAEIEAWNAGQAAAPIAEPQVLPEPPAAALPASNPVRAKAEVAAVEAPVQPLVAPAIPEKKQNTPVTPDPARERRAQGRHTVDTSARLLLVKTAISMTGRIVNLSLGGCRIRTDERFNVGIYVRVEAEFYLHGLPFRVGGVSQAILDKNTIGVRFLDMSDRRRAQLSELIAEISEAAALGLIPGTTVNGDGSGTMPAAG